MLTAGADQVVGTAGDDVITGAGADFDGDVIIDQSSTDNDTLNLTLTAALNTTNTVAGIENVNIDWNAFGTATADIEDITGATVTLTSSKVGFLGNASVANAGSNTVVAGAGMVGTLTVTGADQSVVDAGEAEEVSVTSAGSADADETLTLTAGAATTTITAADFASMTIDAGTADTISLTDANGTGDGDTAQLTIGADATLTNAVDEVTVTAAAAGLTLTVNAVETSLDVAGTEGLTIKVADANDVTAKTITNSSAGTLTFEAGASTAADLTDVDADEFVFTSTIGATINLANASVVTLEADAGASTAFVIGAAGAGTTDAVTINVSTDQADLVVSTVETTTVNVVAEAVDNAADVTFADIDAGTKKVVFTGANDFDITTITAGTVDASAVTSDFTMTQTNDADMNVEGSAGDNEVTFASTTNDSNFTGQDGDDDVTFVTTTGSAVAVLGAGANTVDADALTIGDLVVIAGDGDDTVTAIGLLSDSDDGVAADAANVTLELGGGDNTATLTLTDDGSVVGAAGAVVTVVAGSGDDTVILDAVTNANDELSFTLGTGANTLKLEASSDLSLGTVTVSGLTTIQLGDAADSTVIVNASLVSGKSVTVSSTNEDTLNDDVLNIVSTATAASTIDLSDLVIDRTVDTGLAGTDVTGSAFADTIIGSAFADTIDGGNGNDIITGGAGADVLTGGAGTDKFVFASGDGNVTTVIDEIVDFTAADDSISFGGAAGTATNTVELGQIDTVAVAATVAQMLAAANAAFSATVSYVLVENGTTDAGNAGAGAIAATDSYLFADLNGDQSADIAILLTGVNAAAEFTFADIVA